MGRKILIPVVGLKTWDIPGVIKAASIKDAEKKIKALLKKFQQP